jgi:hypothetical protein
MSVLRQALSGQSKRKVLSGQINLSDICKCKEKTKKRLKYFEKPLTTVLKCAIIHHIKTKDLK